MALSLKELINSRYFVSASSRYEQKIIGKIKVLVRVEEEMVRK
jgi:hypothetical protein